MPTTKHRINITTNKDIEDALIRSAKRAGIPVASRAADLLRDALELEEDLAWGEVIKERTSKKVKFLTHKQVWG